MPTYVLTVDGVDLSPPAADLISLRTAYNRPRELVFAVADRTSVGLMETVVLSVDGTVRFRGVTVAAGPDEQLGKANKITAYDLSWLSDAVQILEWKWELGVGALSTMFYGKYSVALATLLAEIEAAAVTDLDAAGVTAGTVFSGATAGTVRAMDLHPAAFREFLERILEAVSGVKYLYVPDPSPAGSAGTFKIVDTFAGTPWTVSVPGEQATGALESLGLTRSLEGRYSTVIIEPIVYSSESNPVVIALTAAWDAGLEASWSLDAAGTPGTAMADVYRKYSFASLQYQVITEGMQALQVVPRWPGDATGVALPIEIESVDNANQVLWTKQPAVNYYLNRNSGVNVWVPGQAKPAMAVALYCKVLEQHIATEATAGPNGTAYSRYGLERTLRVTVDSVQDVTAAYAQEILDLVRDELISGSVNLVGAMPAGLWDLGVLLNISGAGSDLETMNAIVTGYRHEFAGGGRTSVELTTDKSAFARGSLPA